MKKNIILSNREGISHAYLEVKQLSYQKTNDLIVSQKYNTLRVWYILGSVHHDTHISCDVHFCSHFMGLVEGKQLLKVTALTHGRARIPAQDLSYPKLEVLNLPLHFLKESMERA